MSRLVRRDPAYAYPGYGRDRGITDLALWELPTGEYLAILTERDDNPGASVTNRSEVIATQLLAELGLAHPAFLHIVEHYGHSSVQPEHWTWVRYTWNAEQARYETPVWSPVSSEELTSLGIDPYV